MIRLSAFADEISPDLDEQVAVLRAEGIGHLDLRGVWNTNVLDLSSAQLAEIQHTLIDEGIGVSAIASPIGKVPIDSPFDEHLRRFEHAITLAKLFNTPFIRIFSFYLPSNSNATGPAEWRDEALHRLHALTTLASAEDIVLLHENEKGIYGDTIARCTDLLKSIDNVHFQAILDPANFIQSGQTPYPDAYNTLQPWLKYIHVKDALPDGSVVAAGEGIAHWPQLLQQLHDDGYDGFLSLEPHLASAGQYAGFSGPDLFRYASQALQDMLHVMDWEFA